MPTVTFSQGKADVQILKYVGNIGLFVLVKSHQVENDGEGENLLHRGHRMLLKQ